jgi:hypothetical protein
MLSIPGYCASSGHDFGVLSGLADKYGTDKGPKVHNYTEVYEYFFLPVKFEARKICEIGVAEGASLKMFRDYFPNAVVYGIDIVDSTKLNSKRIKTFIADQADRKQLGDFINAYGGDYDIILDDGGHTMEQQQVSFGYLFKYLKPGGYYIIEDVDTSLMGIAYGVEKDSGNTTLTMINDFMKYNIISSRYMTTEEASYLSENINYVNLLCKNRRQDSHFNLSYGKIGQSNTCIFKGQSITCIFKKKGT